jgi:hypothetical protein
MMSAPTAAHAVSEQQQEKKLMVLEDHLKAMEYIDRERDCRIEQNEINQQTTCLSLRS